MKWKIIELINLKLLNYFIEELKYVNIKHHFDKSKTQQHF